MAVKKPKVTKPSFGINDILKFLDSQIIGDKAKGLWQEAGNIPMPNVGDMTAGSGNWLGGISPTTLALGAKAGKGIEGLANTGVGQWFGADSAFNLVKPNKSTAQNAGDMANLLFSIAPLGGGAALKKAKGAVKGGSAATKEVLSMIKMLMGMQGK